VTSSPAYCSPSIPAYQLRPSTSPPVPPLRRLYDYFLKLCATTSSRSTTPSSTSTTTWYFDRLLPEAMRLLLQRVLLLSQQVQLLGALIEYLLKLDWLLQQLILNNSYDYSWRISALHRFRSATSSRLVEYVYSSR
jgi:hypothetical protein